MIVVSGPGSVWSNRATLYLGNSVGGNQMIISNGGAVYNGSAYIGASQVASNNTVIVSGAGSVWRNFGDYLFVGFGSGGNRLFILDGGKVYSRGAELSDFSGGANQVIVSGPGSLWNNASNLSIGLSGNVDELTIRDGGSVITSNVYVSTVSGTISNRINILNGSLFVTNGVISVGRGGSGEMWVSNGTVLAQEIILAKFANSQGTMTIAGGTVNVSGGTVTIGSQGTGEMSVSNGVVLAQDFFVGDTNGAVGTLTMNGGAIVTGRMRLGNLGGSTGRVFATNASVTSTNDIIIGYDGDGAMYLSNSIVSAGALAASCINGPGTLTAVDSTLTMSILYVGFGNHATSTVWITRGRLIATNLTTVAYSNPGQMTCSNSILNLGMLTVGYSSVLAGTLTVSGGTLSARQIEAGYSGSGTGVVWICDGADVTATNDASCLGRSGIGALTVSNSTVRLAALTIVNYDVANCGTLTVAGGTVTLSGTLTTAAQRFSYMGTKASIWLDGGTLIATNAPSYIGLGGNGQMDISNGVYLATSVTVGGLGSTLTVAGGAACLSDSLFIGVADCSGSGTVAVVGGNLYVTNAAHTGTIEVRKGTLAITGGSLVADRIVMTNSCGRFIRTGGTLIYGSAVLDPSLDADGDGMPNGWEQSHGLDPLNPADANADSDGDGQSNLAEFLAGTDPTDSASAFRITSIAPEGADVRVTWQTGIGRTNALQATTDFSNSFADIFIVTNTVGAETNYLDVGVATNFPSRLYRVRLVP